ncbi:hypothetical protein [Nesterenkonia sandarakina]|uniref:Uncharacterized protein n=1 Tax=Nesterenkonia sandarakina TaxID=272918 RepID=A0A7Z0EAM8_9MICC|nr:hypothetical protein [Nesterenkonia sandarakina]NYJ18069.1 hypothetical protein [Nesterenkonia sandarakina]
MVWGFVLGLVGAGGGLVMLLQPWKSCPEIDDSSTACPATSAESVLLFVLLVISLLGVGLVAKALLTSPPGGEPRIPPGPRGFGADGQ